MTRHRFDRQSAIFRINELEMAHELFGDTLPALLAELNGRLAA